MLTVPFFGFRTKWVCFNRIFVRGVPGRFWTSDTPGSPHPLRPPLLEADESLAARRHGRYLDATDIDGAAGYGRIEGRIGIRQRLGWGTPWFSPVLFGDGILFWEF